jgi:SGNH hydrolase-like domain, acetyltransferase AlgX
VTDASDKMGIPKAAADAASAGPTAVTAARAKSSGLVSRVYVVALGLFVLLCAVQTLFPIWRFESLDEHRGPARFEDYLGHLLKHDTQVPEALSNWFDDRFGFRSPFVRAYNEFQYEVFGTNSRVFIGRDNFLFDKNILSEELTWSRRNATPNKAAFLAQVREWSAYLGKRGIKLVLVPIPPKHDFYGAYLPAYALRPAGTLLAHQLRPLLSAQENIIYVDADGALRTAVAKGLPDNVYYRNDPHQNFWGGLAVAQATAEAIAADAKMAIPPWHRFNAVRLHSFPGGYEQRSLGLFKPVLERLRAPSDFGAIGADTDTGYWQVEDKSLGIDVKNPNALFEYFYHARENRLQGLLPPIFIYGDSSADQLVAARFQEEFSAVYRSRQSPSLPIVPLVKVMQHIPEGVKYFLVVFNEAVAGRYISPEFSIASQNE